MSRKKGRSSKTFSFQSHPQTEQNILYGRRTVHEFLRSKHPHEAVKNIYYLDAIPDDLKQILKQKCRKARMHLIQRPEMDARFHANHQGIVLQIEAAHYPGLHSTDLFDFMGSNPGPYLVLDRIQDSQNLGSLIRTAEALGATALILTGRGVSLDATVHRISSGASLHLPVFQTTNLERFCARARDLNFWICASAAPEDLVQLSDDKKPGPTGLLMEHHQTSEKLPPPAELILIIGSEGSGVKPLVLARCDYLISIPLSGATSSLNAGVAAGILLDRIINR